MRRICRATERSDRWAALRRLGDRYQATETAADLAALTFRIRAEYRDRVLDIRAIAEASRLPASRLYPILVHAPTPPAPDWCNMHNGPFDPVTIGPWVLCRCQGV